MTAPVIKIIKANCNIIAFDTTNKNTINMYQKIIIVIESMIEIKVEVQTERYLCSKIWKKELNGDAVSAIQPYGHYYGQIIYNIRQIT